MGVVVLRSSWISLNRANAVFEIELRWMGKPRPCRLNSVRSLVKLGIGINYPSPRAPDTRASHISLVLLRMPLG